MNKLYYTVLTLIVLLVSCTPKHNTIDVLEKPSHQDIEKLMDIAVETNVKSVSFYMENDIIHITLLEGISDVIITSEIANYPIGIFNTHDAVNMIQWIYEYPLDKETATNGLYTNIYYQDIIAEKIWE